jgi:outer membrane protein assembly factor BamB
LYALEADTGVLRWKYRTESKIYSAPDVQDNQVYFTSVDGALFAVK